ncbi:hypothetical protein [Microbulbifer sp. DLAB2-AA]|uniref:hypothetical protein n=1 Tax=Microbulbifer sp. DLAB2-AA TaxID=3243394 RepID=UPI00403922BB
MNGLFMMKPTWSLKVVTLALRTVTPSLRSVGVFLGGALPQVMKNIHDMIVIGADPIGITAAVQLLSRGLQPLVLKKDTTIGSAMLKNAFHFYLSKIIGIVGKLVLIVKH